MTLMSTRHFIQNNKNLKSQKPIVVIKGEQLIDNGSVVGRWCPVYILDIFHLSFIIRPTKCVLIKSSLIGDNLKEYTDAKDIRDSQLYNFVLILMSNIDNMIADAAYEMKVKTEIIDFILYFNTRMEFKSLIHSAFFQIGYIDSIGLVFKQAIRGVNMSYIVGRPIMTMGQFNVALFGHIHDTLIVDSEIKKEQQKGFAISYRFSGFLDGGSMMDKTYDDCLTDLKNMCIPHIRHLVEKFTMPMCNNKHICESLIEYAIEHRTGRRLTCCH